MLLVSLGELLHIKMEWSKESKKKWPQTEISVPKEGQVLVLKLGRGSIAAESWLASAHIPAG